MAVFAAQDLVLLSFNLLNVSTITITQTDRARQRQKYFLLYSHILPRRCRASAVYDMIRYDMAYLRALKS